MVIDKGGVGTMPIMLVVGDLRDWAHKGREVPQIDGFHFAGILDISTDFLERVKPDLVLSSLMSGSFDAVDLARRLIDSGFRGRYRALTVELPNPGAVIAEISSSAPELDFDLFVIDGMPPDQG